MLRTGTLVTPVAVYPFSGFSDAIAHADHGGKILFDIKAD